VARTLSLLSHHPGFPGGRVKFFDTKYRLFGVINVIDLVVILAVLVGGFAVYRVLSPKASGGKGSADRSITVDVVCPTMRNVEAANVHVGDPITKNTSGKPFGTVTAVRVVPSPSEVWDYNLHKVVPFQSTIFSDIIISVSAKGQPTANGVVVGDIALHSGQPFPVMTSTFDCDTAFLANLKINGKP
jgi:hypothetical protein